MANVTHISVHKNTKEKRQRHLVSGRLKDAIKHINKDKRVVGYALVAWTDEYDARCDWWFEGIQSARSTPERVKQALLHALNDTHEDD